MTAAGFAVAAIEPLVLDCPTPVAGMFVLSPFVWADDGGYSALFRVVPDCEDAARKIARVHYARSADGLSFKIEPEVVIAPGPAPDDRDGCEDPTVAIVDGRYHVYYSGWNEVEKVGRLLLASGASPRALEKRGVALASTEPQANPKEATLVLAVDGRWRLFYEYAAEGASRIGVASAPAADGPWTGERPLFEAREGKWDGWHLSTGPMLDDPDRPVMFYNGATQDAHWRIGWIAFSPDYARVVDRCDAPLIVPEIEPGSNLTDIAFAASCVSDGDDIRLYYSIADRAMMRATLRRC